MFTYTLHLDTPFGLFIVVPHVSAIKAARGVADHGGSSHVHAEQKGPLPKILYWIAGHIVLREQRKAREAWAKKEKEAEAAYYANLVAMRDSIVKNAVVETPLDDRPEWERKLMGEAVKDDGFESLLASHPELAPSPKTDQ